MIDVLALDCECKVGRVARRHELDDVHDALHRRWTADGDSLRDLARWFDCRVLEAALREVGEDPRGPEVRRLYDALPDAESDRPVPAPLDRPDLSISRLRRDFVSHQTIHSHLRDCLQVSRDPSDEALGTVERLRARTENAAERTLRSHAREDLALEEFGVDVAVSVTCSACGRTRPLDDLLADRGCRCLQG